MICASVQFNQLETCRNSPMIILKRFWIIDDSVTDLIKHFLLFKELMTIDALIRYVDLEQCVWMQA